MVGVELVVQLAPPSLICNAMNLTAQESHHKAFLQISSGPVCCVMMDDVVCRVDVEHCASEPDTDGQCCFTEEGR